MLAPRFLAALAALLLAISLSARAAAKSCIGHAYEHMDVELSAVYRGDTKVPRPPELGDLDQLLNSGGAGKGLLFWARATMGFAKFYQLTEEIQPAPEVAPYLKSSSSRKLMTGCGYEVSYTPILPGRYVFEQEHMDGARVSVGIGEPEVIVAPGRDHVELRFSVGGQRYRAVYTVTCAYFDWQRGQKQCAPSAASTIAIPMAPDAPAPAPAKPEAAEPEAAPGADPPSGPPRVEVAPSPPPVEPTAGGCGGCSAAPAEDARGWGALLIALGLCAFRGTRRRALPERSGAVPGGSAAEPGAR